MTECPSLNKKKKKTMIGYHGINSMTLIRADDMYNGQFQVTVFPRFCYVLLCNHEYIRCQNRRQAKDYITRRNETERKL